MALKRNTGHNVPPATMLTISKADFNERLNKRIEIGEELFNRPINDDQAFKNLDNDYELWNEYNFEMLKQIFSNPQNEYWHTYDHAGFGFLGDSLGEVHNNRLQTKKNLIEYKLKNLKGLLLKSDLLKSIEPDSNRRTTSKIETKSLTEVFIVHGHDDLAKIKLARFIEKLGLKPIILHEQTNSGKTIIEKIEEYSNVGYGIVLYTPCDTGSKKGDEKTQRTEPDKTLYLNMDI